MRTSPSVPSFSATCSRSTFAVEVVDGFGPMAAGRRIGSLSAKSPGPPLLLTVLLSGNWTGWFVVALRPLASPEFAKGLVLVLVPVSAPMPRAPKFTRATKALVTPAVSGRRQA